MSAGEVPPQGQEPEQPPRMDPTGLAQLREHQIGQMGDEQQAALERAQLDQMLEHFMLQPEPKTEDETETVLGQIVDYLKAARDWADRTFGLHLQSSQAAQGMLQDRVVQEAQQHAAIAQISDQLLSQNQRMPDVQASIADQIAGLSEMGVPPEEVARLEGKLRENVDFLTAVDEDTARLGERLADWQEQGGITRALEAPTMGALSGLTGGYLGGSREERIRSDLEREFGKIRYERFGVPSGQTPSPAIARDIRERLERGGRRPSIPREPYLATMTDRLRGLMGAMGEVEGLGSDWYERILNPAGEIAGMFVPFGKAIQGGQAAVRGATGLARLSGIMRATGVKLGDDALETIMRLGAPKSLLGKAAQKLGGGALGLAGYGYAEAIPAEEEDRISSLPAERQDAAREATRINQALRTVATGPLMMLSGALGAKAGGWVGRSAITAGTFQVGGEALQVAEKGAKDLLAKLSPEMARQMELQIIANPELQGPIARMLKSGGPDDPAFGKALQDFGEQLLGGFAGFGVLHGLHAFGAPPTPETNRMAKEAQFDLRRRLAEEESLSPEVRAELQKQIDALAAEFAPSYAERERRSLEGEMEREFGEGASKAIEERFDVGRVKEGEATTKAERLEEVAALRREADIAVEEGEAARAPEAERLRAAEEFLRAEDPAQAEAWLQRYEGVEGEMPPAPSRALAARRAVEIERQAPEISRQLLRERAQEAVEAPLPEHWSSKPVWRDLPEERVQALDEVRTRLSRPLDPTRRAIAEGQAREMLVEQFGEQQGEGLTRRWLGEVVVQPEKPGPEAGGGLGAEKLPQEPVFDALRRWETEGRNPAALEKLDEPTRQALLDVAQRPDMKGADAERIAAETVWLREHRMAGEADPRENAEQATGRFARELDTVRATENPATLLAWQRLTRPDMEGPFGTLARQWAPARQVIEDVGRYAVEQFGQAANAGQLGHLLTPLSPPLEIFRLLWWGLGTRGDFLERADRWTKHSGRDILDPIFLDNRKAILEAVKEVSPYKFAARTLTRLVPMFGTPRGRFGELGDDAGRMFQAVDRLKVDMMNQVQAILKDLPESARDAPRDANEPRHLITMLMRDPDHPGWKEPVHARIEEVRSAAKKIRTILDSFVDSVAEASPYWGKLLRRVEIAERIIAEDSAKIAELEPKVAEMEARQAEFWPELTSDIAQQKATAKRLAAKRNKASKAERDDLEAELREAKKSLRGEEDGAMRDLWKDEIARIEERLAELREPSAEEKEARKRTGELSSALREEAITAKMDVVPMRRELANLRRVVTDQKRVLAREQQRMETYKDIWRQKKEAGDYVHDIRLADMAQPYSPAAESKRFGLHDHVVDRVTANLAKRKTGRLYESGREDPDVGRWMFDYLQKVVPYFEHQKFLRRWSEKLDGRWDRLAPRDLLRGIDSHRAGQFYNAEITYDRQPYQAVLGRFWKVKTEDGVSYLPKNPKEGGAKPVFLLWKGRSPAKEGGELVDVEKPKPAKLADAEWLKGSAARSNLTEVSRRTKRGAAPASLEEARAKILVRSGGFFRMAQEAPARELKKYINHTMKAAKTLDRYMDMGPFVRGAEKVAANIGYVMSTAKLGLDPGVALRGFGGAYLMNSYLLGPQRAATSMRHATEHQRRILKAGLKGEPSMDLAGVERLEAGEGVLSVRSRMANKLRTGKNQLLDDAHVAIYEMAVNSGTRGFDWFETHPELRQQHPIWRAAQKGMAVPWLGWTVLEPVVRTSLGIDTYMSARKAGRSDEQARTLAYRMVHQAHGVFNQATRSPFFRTGFGKMLGPAEGWWRHFSGVYADLDPGQKATMIGYGAALAALGTAIGLPLGGLFTSTMGDVPYVGDDAQAAIFERFPELRKAFPNGLPLWPGKFDIGSMTTDVIDNLVDATIASTVDEDAVVAGDSLWKAADRSLRPTFLESARKWLLATFDPESGERMYRPGLRGFFYDMGWADYGGDLKVVRDHPLGPLFDAKKGTLLHGLGEMFLQTLVPSESFYQASEHIDRVLMYRRNRREATRKKEVRTDLKRWMETLGRSEVEELARQVKSQPGTSMADLYVGALGKQYPRLAEIQKRWQEAYGEPMTGQSFRDQASGAVASLSGLSQIYRAVNSAPSKTRKVEALVEWLESGQKISEWQWEKMKQAVAPGGGWNKWIWLNAEMRMKDRALLERLQAAAKAKGFTP